MPLLSGHAIAWYIYGVYECLCVCPYSCVRERVRARVHATVCKCLCVVDSCLFSYAIVYSLSNYSDPIKMDQCRKYIMYLELISHEIRHRCIRYRLGHRTNESISLEHQKYYRYLILAMIFILHWSEGMLKTPLRHNLGHLSVKVWSAPVFERPVATMVNITYCPWTYWEKII